MHGRHQSRRAAMAVRTPLGGLARMSSPRTKPSLTSLVALGMLLAVLYVLSYAPAVRVCCEPPPQRVYIRRFNQLPGVDPHPLAAYRPVDFLIDHTPLRDPLFAWESLWHVDGDIKLAYAQRTGRTDYDPRANPR